MTASVFSSVIVCGEASTEANMVDHKDELDGPQPMSAESSGANIPSHTSSWFLSDRTVSEPPVLQRSHSVSLPSTTLLQNQFVNNLIKAPSVTAADSNNKENGFRERSYSELGDRSQLSSPFCMGAGSQVNMGRYKTELCRPFQENGTCKYGEKCQFAHGMHELRSLSRHPKYKTELCRTYHTVGFCPYGPRCHFIHNAEERHGPPPLSAFNKLERPRLQHSFSFAGFPSSNMQDSPSLVTPPPIFNTSDTNPLSCSQELVGLFSPRPSVSSQGKGSALPSTTPSCFHPTSVSPSSPTNSLSDQDSYQSSVGSHSGSDSPLLDVSRRLPIFSRLSVTDD